MPAIAPITVSVLRHLLVHGLCTKADIKTGVGNDLPASTISNLVHLGHIRSDHTTKDVRYAITPRGMAKLQGIALSRDAGHNARAEAARRARSYQPSDLPPSFRPGAMDAFALPSRVGDRLHWPDGRITSIDHH